MNHHIRQLRLARGFSLDGLAIAMGGLVTKQALSKYERGLCKPSPRVLARLASVLGVRALDLWNEPSIKIRFMGYRRRRGLRTRQRATLEAIIAERLRERCQLQAKCRLAEPDDFGLPTFQAVCSEDAEAAAEALRQHWQLGLDPISDLIAVLEAHAIHVVEVATREEFDGISAFAENAEGKTIMAAVATRAGVPGERQRLSLAHELGHLVLRPVAGADEEALAYRFAGALLLPRPCLLREMGSRRTALRIEELLLMKARYKISLQAILRRLLDLAVISKEYYRCCCIQINRLGWRRREPAEIPAEQSQWLKQVVLRGVAEGWITSDKARQLLGEQWQDQPLTTLQHRRAFFSLPPEERQRLLREQAEAMAEVYARDPSWKDIQGGDILE